MAQDSVGQSVDSVNVTIELRKESLAELFQKIENQSSLRFAYKVQNIERYSNLNLPLEARTVRATLDLIFQDTPLRYKQVDNNVIVNEEQGNSGTRNAEDVVITGRVKTRDGTPLPGVSVFVKGTTTGTATNPDGTYAVEVGSNDVLIFSFIGFKTYQASVTNMAVMDVVLEEDATTLNEVQINGVTTQQHRQQAQAILRALPQPILPVSLLSIHYNHFRAEWPGLKLFSRVVFPEAPYRFRSGAETACARMQADHFM